MRKSFVYRFHSVLKLAVTSLTFFLSYIYVRISVHPYVHMFPLEGPRASQAGLRPSQSGLLASQASEPASQASEPANQASEPASQASEALRPAWLALRPDWLGLRPAWLALGPSRGGTDGRTDVRTYVRTENLPILQDFVPYWDRCPATAQLQPKNCVKQGKGTAGRS